MIVAGWGCTDSGQLGPHPQSDVLSTPSALSFTLPSEFTSASAVPTSASAGESTSVVLFRNLPTPVVLPAPTNPPSDLPTITSVSAGGEFTLYTSATGMLLVDGTGTFGQLGHGPDTTFLSSPSAITAMHHVRVTATAAGTRHWLALDTTGTVWACGHNASGQCGSGNTESIHYPAVVTALWAVPVVAVSAGELHSAVLSSTGDVYCFGSSKAAQIGQPGFTLKLCAMYPLRVPVPEEGRLAPAPDADGDVDMDAGEGMGETEEEVMQRLHYVDVAAGGMHTVALRSDGVVVCWGLGEHGQVGARSTATALQPTVVVPSGTDPGLRFVSVSAGARHSAAVADDGRAFLWGDGSLGQVGDGDMSDKLLPIEVRPPRAADPSKLPHFVRIWCGAFHNIAFVSDDAVEPVFHAWSAYMQRIPSLRVEAMLNSKAGFPRFSSSGVLCRNYISPGSEDPKAPRVNVHGAECVKAYSSYLALFGAEGEAVLVRAAARLRQEAMAVFGMSVEGEQSIFCAAVPTSAGIVSSSGELNALTTSSKRLKSDEELHREAADMYDCGAVLFLAFFNPIYSIKSHHRIRELAELNTLAVRIRDDAVRGFSDCAQSCDPELLSKCLVIPLQYLISDELRSNGKVTRRAVNASKVLGMVYEANSAKLERLTLAEGPMSKKTPEDLTQCVVPEEAFYNDEVSDMIDLKHDWERWNLGHSRDDGENSRDMDVIPGTLPQAAKKPRDDGQFSFCDYSFLLNKVAKFKVLGHEAKAAMGDEFFRSFNGFGMVSMPLDALALMTNVRFFVLHVRRSHIVGDTFHQLAQCAEKSPRNLHKPLRVRFEGEPGQDEGGLTKEFFQVLFDEILGASYGMFTHDPETRQHWIARDSMADIKDFKLVGVAAGLALFNSILLDVQFPAVIFRKLHSALQQANGHRQDGYQASLADVMDVFPSIGTSLSNLLSYEGGDVEEVFCLTYEISYEGLFGKEKSHVLVPGGAEKAVTNANREDFVQRYCHWLINESIAPYFNEFANGMLGMMNGKFVAKLTPAELETLVVGEVDLDFEALRASCRYEGYEADSPVIQYLWTVLFELDVPGRQKFLQFVCGSDRAPIGGLGNLKLMVQRSSADSDRLPTAHTCFNVLLLPEYLSRAKLRNLLLVAINNSTGFGLN